MKLTTLLTFIASSCVCPIAFSATDIQKQTLPTENAEPLPTLQTVKNIDTVLSEKVQAEMTNNPLLKGQAVSAASHEQVVTLQGSVESQVQADEAFKTAKSVSGVKEVKSQLTIKGLSE